MRSQILRLFTARAVTLHLKVKRTIWLLVLHLAAVSIFDIRHSDHFVIGELLHHLRAHAEIHLTIHYLPRATKILTALAAITLIAVGTSFRLVGEWVLRKINE